MFEATPSELMDSSGDTIQKDTRCVVKKYCDGMLDVLPMSKSPMKNDDCVASLKLVELQIQSKGLLRAGFVKPAKAPYEAQAFLREEENGRLYVDNRVLKQASRRGPTFGSVGVTQPIIAHTSVFDYVLDNVLVHNGQPVASKGWRLSTTEMSYTVFEEETLVMVHSLRDARQYSHRSTFVRETNNNVVSHFSTQPNLTLSQVGAERHARA